MPRRSPAPAPAESESRFRILISPHRQREIAGLLLIALGVLTLLSLLGFAGSVTAVWAMLLMRFTGWGAYVLALLIILGGIALLRRQANIYGEYQVPWARILGIEVIYTASMGLLSLAMAVDDREALRLAENGEAGGYLGLALSSLLTRAFSNVAEADIATILAALVLVVLTLVTLRLVFDLRGISAVITRTLESLRPSVAVAAATPAPAGRGPLTPNPSRNTPTGVNSGSWRDVVSPGETALPPRLPPSESLRQLPLPKKSEPSPGVAEQESLPETAKREPGKRASEEARTPLFGLGLRPRKTEPVPALPPPPKHDPLLAVPRALALKRAGQLPPSDLLVASAEAQFAQSTAEDKKKIIERTLSEFGIPASVTHYSAGPTITQFAVEPGFIERRGLDGQMQRRKVPVNRILALSNDLSLALAASPIRIEAPVPGRSYVGIEVPNESISLVSLRGVIDSEKYKKDQQKAKLLFALGRDVAGDPYDADLEKMPHLLIAGATGSGKSVAINAIIACLLLSHSPDTLRMVMVDPKRVELINYNGIPHLLGEVITNVEHVVPALRWATQLMDGRLQVFSKEQTRNLEAYNAKMDKKGGDKLPYVIIIIDELADLMLAAPDETEKLITRLAQLARATGIHLILATQRPSVDVVTGLIKANFPARISFAVTSSVDSRVVLDTPGAEKLLGRGDMLYMAPDSAKLQRLQGCFVSDEELARLTGHWRGLQELFDYVAQPPWANQARGGKADEKGGDDLIEDAIEVIRKNNQASISMLQRKLGIGYPRAARLMDQLEERGVVGPDEGNGKPRAIFLEDKAKKKK